ncbi:24240_t:CDS:2 [Gigaspora margarita]|uniref:24240_t:CDS:1 n=1 Tax=Gigaspora margarita TaxID=4874 RepID=A0ABN7V1P2_GIGMA|nr:24240_t:CDS:2 [Gigaspora margarita]
MTQVSTNDYVKTAISSKPESLICYSPDYFNESTISNTAVLPISSDEQVKIETYPNKSGDAVSTRSDRKELSINNTESRESADIKPDDSSNCGNWCDDDLEMDSEPDTNDNNSREIESSSKSLSSVSKDKKTPETTVCQVEITQDRETKKCGQKYDRTNSNSTSSMNYHITQEHNIVLESLAKKARKKEQVTLEQVIENINHMAKISKMNYKLHLSTLDMDEEIGSGEEDENSEEIDESTIKILHNISDIYPKSEDDTYSHASLPNLNQLEKEFKIAISDSLNKYWLNFCEVGLVATLLDPRTKKMSHLNITSDDQPQQISTLITTKITQNPFFEGIFRV